MISSRLSSPALQPPSSSSSKNPWKLNSSGPLPIPFMGEPSSWPPLPSQMHAAVTASATADPAVESISDQERTALLRESAPSRADPNHQGTRNRHNNSCRHHEGRGRGNDDKFKFYGP